MIKFILLAVSLFSPNVFADATCKMNPALVIIGTVGIDTTVAQYGIGTSFIPITIVPETQSGHCNHVIIHGLIPGGPFTLQNMGADVVGNSTLQANFRVYFSPKDFPHGAKYTFTFTDEDRVAQWISVGVQASIEIPKN